ncbi:MAG: tetratricopeptide repeat protein [bacterium]
MPSGVPEVVIVSASPASGEGARALLRLLDSGKAVLLTEELAESPTGPLTVFNALLDATVLVLFLDEVFFESPFGRVLTPLLDSLVAEIGPRLGLLQGVVLTFPGGPIRRVVDRLPPELRALRWGVTDNIPELWKDVESRRVAQRGESFQHALGIEGTARLRQRVIASLPLPPAQSIPAGMPQVGVPPLQPGLFTGRGGLLIELAQLLGAPGSVAVALQAAGGAGKSRVALEYLYRYGIGAAPGGVFWLDASEATGREAQLHAVLRQLDPAAPLLRELLEAEVDLDQRIRQILLEREVGRPVFWVVDDWSVASGDLALWAPLGLPSIKVIATSRQRIPDVTATVLVEALEPGSAIQLLSAGLPPGIVNESDAQRIVQAVDGWPLALQLLNAALYTSAFSTGEFLRRLAQPDTTAARQRTTAALGEQVRPAAIPGIVTTLLLCYERLTQDAQRLGQVLAEWAPESVPVELLDALGAEIASPQIRASLRARSFVGPAEGSAVGAMHPLVAAFLRAQDETHQQRTLAMKTFHRIFDGLNSENSAFWPLLSRLAPHGMALFQRRELPPEEAVPLGRSLGAFYRNQGLWRTAKAIRQEVYDLAQAHLPRASRHRFFAMQELVSTLWNLGELGQARPIIEDLVAQREAVRLIDPSLEVTALSQLSLLYIDEGRYGEARSLAEEVLERRTQTLGLYHRDTRTAMGNLAWVLELQGDLTRARGLLEQLLAIQREVYDTEHIDILTTLNNLGAVHKRQGNPVSAKALMEEALVGRQRLLGTRHPLTLICQNNLGEIEWDLGAVAIAERLHTEAAKAREEILGGKHPLTLASMRNLGKARALLGGLDEARVMLEGVAEALKTIHGEAHPQVMLTRTWLGAARLWAGDSAGAARLLQPVATAQIDRLGPGHPDTLRTRWLLLMSQLEAAQAFAQREAARALLAESQAAMGADHPDTLIGRWIEARAFLMQGVTVQSEIFLVETVDAMRATLPPRRWERSVAVWDLVTLWRGMHSQKGVALAAEEFSWLREETGRVALPQQRIKTAFEKQG